MVNKLKKSWQVDGKTKNRLMTSLHQQHDNLDYKNTSVHFFSEKINDGCCRYCEEHTIHSKSSLDVTEISKRTLQNDYPKNGNETSPQIHENWIAIKKTITSLFKIRRKKEIRVCFFR